MPALPDFVALRLFFSALQHCLLCLAVMGNACQRLGRRGVIVQHHSLQNMLT
jgi:hypothetical protein